MAEEIRNTVERIYGFVMRDLAYIFAGSLLLASIKYAYGGSIEDLKDVTDYVSQNSIKFIIFVGVSYFIGVIILHSAELFRIIKTKVEVPEPYDSEELLMSAIHSKYGMETVRRLERIIYLKHFGAAVGSASLAGLLISLIPLINYHRTGNFVISFVLVFFAAISIAENWLKRGKQQKTLKQFADDLRKTLS